MSAITPVYPVHSPAFTPAHATAAAIERPWRFWSTLGWLAAAYAVMLEASHVLSGVQTSLPDLDPSVLGHLRWMVPMLAATLFLLLVAHWRGPSARAYLGLAWPRWHHILIAFAVLAALGLSIAGLGSASPRLYSPAEQQLITQYRAMGSVTAVVLYWIVLVVIAPVTEEIIFRGFLQHGWSESRIDTAHAIFLSTLVFAFMHAHYGVLGMAMVFVSALTFSVARWYTGSTLLAIMMHAGWNLNCGIQIAARAA